MHQPEKSGISRRSFLDRLLGLGAVAWVGSVVYPIFEYLRTPPQGEAEVTSVVAAKVKDVKPNTGTVFRFGRDPAILVSGPDGKLRALSAVCTHLQCTVQYRSDMQRIWCACHNGVYDLTGRNVSGPPPRPLTEFVVTVKGDDVVVSRT